MWIVVALLTAICWGLCYVAAGQALKGSDKCSYIAVASLINLIVYSIFAKDYSTLLLNKWWLCTAIAASVAGNFLSVYAIQLKSATHAAAIEISYPLWCALFTIILLQENPLTNRSCFGLSLVLVGMAIFVLSDK